MDLSKPPKNYPCKHCGELFSEHCIGYEQIDVPEGCQCDPESWDEAIPPICDHYTDDGPGKKGICDNCDHDRECHKEAACRPED